MRSARFDLCVFAAVLALSATVHRPSMGWAQAAQSPPILAKRVASFSVRGVCLVDALLTLGQQEQVPLGIEYVDRGALEKPITHDFRHATIGEIVQVLLGGKGGYTWRVRDGVLNIGHQSTAAPGNLLDRVLPEFEISKCPIRTASAALYFALYRDLHTEVTGYAGEFDPGNPDNVIGPLKVRNTTVRHILNLLANGSKKGAWIVRVPPGHLDQLPPDGLWTIIEYETPPRRYAADLQREIFGWGPRPASRKTE